MAKKETKERKRGDTYPISTGKHDNPKLFAKVLSGGQTASLFLESYYGTNEEGKILRERETLKGLFVYTNGKPKENKQHNDETLLLAKKIRFEREQQLLEDREGYRLGRKRQDVDFLAYFRAYLDDYGKKDKAVVKMAYTRFCDFLKDTPKYSKHSKGIKPEQVSKDMMVDFTAYLQSRSTGTGALSVYGRFKTFVYYAIEHDVLRKNPCEKVSIKADTNTLRKDVLSQDEVRTLLSTEFKGTCGDVKRAFVLTLYTGIRFCDVKGLTFSNIDFSNKKLRFEQRKVKGHSSNSTVTTPLNDGLLELIGKGEPTDLIFHLPERRTCVRQVQDWVKAAGIGKHITWHCGRHTFATMVLENGMDIFTTSRLMGHSSITMTEKYLHEVDKRKQAAIDSLPALNWGG